MERIAQMNTKTLFGCTLFSEEQSHTPQTVNDSRRQMCRNKSRDIEMLYITQSYDLGSEETFLVTFENISSSHESLRSGG